MKRKVKLNPGDVVCVDLSNGTNAFARVLHGPLLAFYDMCLDTDASADLEQITSASVLFTVPVMNDAVEAGRWPVIGSRALESDLQKPVTMFKQDAISKNLTLYTESPNGQYEERAATREECAGLERAAVWNPQHVEDRLRDHYANLPNQWVESLKVK